MGYICRHIYVVTENLPFPMARVGADTSLALSERPPDMMRTLILSAAIGQFYSILVFVPIIVYGFSLVPYPWIDLTRFVEKLMPGASLAIATDIIPLSYGLIMPFTAVVSMFIGSFSLYFLGNWLTSPESPLDITRGLFKDWVFGMQAQETYVRSNMYVWASVLIGLALAGGLIPVLRRPKTLIRGLRAVYAMRRSETGMSFYSLIAIYILATAGSAILVYLLDPSFPLAILLFISVIWVFLINLISARSLGEIGVSLDMNSLYVTPGLYCFLNESANLVCKQLSSDDKLWCWLVSKLQDMRVDRHLHIQLRESILLYFSLGHYFRHPVYTSFMEHSAYSIINLPLYKRAIPG